MEKKQKIAMKIFVIFIALGSNYLSVNIQGGNTKVLDGNCLGELF